MYCKTELTLTAFHFSETSSNADEIVFFFSIFLCIHLALNDNRQNTIKISLKYISCGMGAAVAQWFSALIPNGGLGVRIPAATDQSRKKVVS